MSGYPRYLKARAHKFKKYTTADLSLATVAVWTVVDPSLDIVLAADVGDVIRAHLNLYSAVQSGHLYFDAHTLVSGALTHQFSTGNPSSTVDDGCPAWLCTSTLQSSPAGWVDYELQSSDIVAGLVTVRLAYHTSTTRSVSSDAARPLIFSAENIGPQDPH